MNVEALKAVNLVEFLSGQYSMEFIRRGQVYVSRSPFGEDRNPSFVVRLLEGRWLFKDFSSGIGGSIIDFVQRMENLVGLPNVFLRLEELLGHPIPQVAVPLPRPAAPSAEPAVPARDYDVETLYRRFRRENPDLCRTYLAGRGIAANLVDELIAAGTVVLNQYQGREYCCFAVRDSRGALQCLDNHEIAGQGKFVLGTKIPFTLDWQELDRGAREVFVCEGAIDYLSMKTLQACSMPGLALLGNRLLFEPELLAPCERIVSALDDDQGGDAALVELYDRYPGKQITIYDLQGCKDPNELLRAGDAKRRLTPAEKLELYREFQRSDNKAALARKWQLDRSHMYKVVKDCEETLLAALANRPLGRPVQGEPATVAEARQMVGQLRQDLEKITVEHAKSVCREEFTKLRLKWAEIEAAELRGDKVDEERGVEQKPHVKKKEKEETVALSRHLHDRFPFLSRGDVFALCHHGRGPLYEWHKGVKERKPRETKQLDEQVLENAAAVISTYPHLGGRKGQAFMLYHALGYIGQKSYEILKKQVRRIIGQELARRKDTPTRKRYEHIRPTAIHDIWAEDFTEILLEGVRFKLALLIDVLSQYILGWALSLSATAGLVAKPVRQALAANGGKGPNLHMLSDNGQQYVCEEHNELLTTHEIIRRLIPAYTPQFNGSVECGGKEFKNLFYNVWEDRERNGTDKEKNLLERAQAAAAETVRLANEVIPRPVLGGVAPADVMAGRQEKRKAEIREYRKAELAKPEPPPLNRPYWEVLTGGVKACAMSTKELLTKLSFYGKEPLRRIAQLNQEVWGN